MRLNHLTANLIVLDFDTPWQWGDFYHWIDKLHTACRQIDGSVYAVVHHQHPLPAGNAMRHFLKAESMHPDNLKRVSVVFRPDDQPTMQTMFRIMTTIQPTSQDIVHLQPTLEAAMAAMQAGVTR